MKHLRPSFLIMVWAVGLMMSDVSVSTAIQTPTETRGDNATPPSVEYQRTIDTPTPLRISIDGDPVDASNTPNNADMTRRIDLALEKADIQVRFDGLENTPVLNIIVNPKSAIRNEDATFTPYSNYTAFIKKAELRIFPEGSSLQRQPLAIVPMNSTLDQAVIWQVPGKSILNAVVYVLRVYDSHGRFDETTPKMLHFLDKARPSGDKKNDQQEALIGYGENHRGIKNIPVVGGSIIVNGEKLLSGTKVWVMGQQIPVDSQGKFASCQIVPAGLHTVNIVTEQKDGMRTELNRLIDIPANDWFYVGMADLTIGKNHVRGPASEVTGDSSGRNKGDTYSDGRLAFYAKGKMKEDWILTASADTKEQPIENLFSNFSAKDPRHLLLRLDPNEYYPVYGDDSTAVDDASTQGKFFVKMANGDSHIMWGNFQTQITGTDLMNYSRSLYGGNAVYKSKDTTKYGEKRAEVNGFAADPGTVGSLEEFRGTGGSLYYLRSQDVVVGSERVRVEIRDKDSGIILQTKSLVYGVDYEINYIQGRIILQQPLSSTADSTTVVNTGSLSGNPAYLVIGYEYTPGISEVENLTKGGRISQWVNDYLKIGVTGYQQGAAGNSQRLLGADATIRYTPGTYLKLETGNSQGMGSGALLSQNGGFNFNPIAQTTTGDVNADAYRAETGIELSDITHGAFSGTFNAYALNRGSGFSAPGQLTNEAIKQEGLTAHLPAGKDLDFDAKFDNKTGHVTGAVRANELAANYHMSLADTLTLAVREDDRETALAAGSSALLAETGRRTDGAIKITHAPLNDKGEKGRYEVYGLGQKTLAKDTNRATNNRVGGGGRYDMNDRISLTGESTAGNGGWGGKAGLDYRASDRTSYYTNYLIDTERSDIGYRGHNSTITSGARSRYSDSLTVFGEENYHNYNNGPSGLIHSFGLDLAPNDKWTYGGRMENGTLSDPSSGDFDRTAISLSTGYNYKKTRYAGAIEWRDENGNSLGRRTSWFMKNKLGYQTTPDWRFLGGLDVAISDSGLNGSLDANYTKASLGYAYRPVADDRLNSLFKYVYLDDHASPGQISSGNQGEANDYKQRSHVLDCDTMYDITAKLGLGGKLGYRMSELKDTTAMESEWFHSQAWLAVARADFHIIKEWDAIGEYRYLNAQEAQDAKAGALVGIYRHINKNLKVGVGYNFTDFSDDLTDLSYKSRGVFINFLGKF